MSLNSLLDSLWFDANVTLRGGGASVLQESLDESNVIATTFVDLSGVPFPEAVSAYAVVAKVVTDNVELLLYSSFGNREDDGGSWDPVTEAVVLNVLLNDQGNGEGSLFPGLLFHNIQVESITILYDITEPQLQDITDSQTEVTLKYQDGGDPFIGTATGKSFFQSLNDLFVLLCSQSFCFLVHGYLLRKFVFLMG